MSGAGRAAVVQRAEMYIYVSDQTTHENHMSAETQWASNHMAQKMIGE